MNNSEVYKAKVVFTVKTKLGLWIEDSVYHVDVSHANRWVKSMGKKIKNATVIY